MILTVTLNPCLDKTLFLPGDFRPGEKNFADSALDVAGGKGNNVARFLRRLGHLDVLAFNFVAGCAGERTLQILRQEGIRTEAFWGEGETRTIFTVHEKSGRYTPVFEPGPEISNTGVGKMCARLKELVKKADVMAVGGSAPRENLGPVFPFLVKQAKQAGCDIFLDTHGPGYLEAVEQGPTMLKPNLDEVKQDFDVSPQTIEDFAEFLTMLREKRGVKVPVVSCGPAPFYLACGGRTVMITPPEIDEVYPVGSGDAFVAGFISARLAGKYPVECAVLGAAAGASNAMRWEMSPLEKNEIEKLEKMVRVVDLK